MRVIKIIQANPELFGSDPNKQYNELEAIRLVASMQCKGNDIQNEAFELRQTHAAICNLMSLGFNNAAVSLAKKLIPHAELAQQFGIALDLCHKLIAHYYHIDDIESANIYQSLYDKFSVNISNEHETMLLCNKTIKNYKKLERQQSINPIELDILVEAVEKKLPFDVTWFHYYYYHYKSLILEGKELELLYLDALAYFDKLHYEHDSFSEVFLERLVIYYLDNYDLKLAEKYLHELNSGSNTWYRTYLAYTQLLLNQNDLKSNDICNFVMNHQTFVNLQSPLKDKWKSAYKASIKLLLGN